jgi:hypothetical protein
MGPRQEDGVGPQHDVVFHDHRSRLGPKVSIFSGDVEVTIEDLTVGSDAHASADDDAAACPDRRTSIDVHVVTQDQLTPRFGLELDRARRPVERHSRTEATDTGVDDRYLAKHTHARADARAPPKLKACLELLDCCCDPPHGRILTKWVPRPQWGGPSSVSRSAAGAPDQFRRAMELRAGDGLVVVIQALALAPRTAEGLRTAEAA